MQYQANSGSKSNRAFRPQEQQVAPWQVRHGVYGQKTTAQKTTENANPGQKTTRTKDHRRRNFVVYVEVVYINFKKNLRKVPVIFASTDMFAAEYRSDNSSGLHCRVIKIQHQTERLYLSRHSVCLLRYNRSALITTQQSAQTWSDAF